MFHQYTDCLHRYALTNDSFRYLYSFFCGKIDKIMDIAMNSFRPTCDLQNEDEEDTDADDPRDRNLLYQTPVNNRIETSTGEPIHVTSLQLVPPKISLANLRISDDASTPLGTFSRLLLTALSILQRRHDLRRDQEHSLYVTRAELRSANSHPFLIRKIYITPATILYEGPYQEEKCAVTRHFEQLQDHFLRVVFRDEGTLPSHSDSSLPTSISRLSTSAELQR